MKQLIQSTVILFTCSANLALADADVVLNDESKAYITEILTGQGYEVGKIKIEDGFYEAYARNENGKFEIFLNGDFKIIEIRED